MYVLSEFENSCGSISHRISLAFHGVSPLRHKTRTSVMQLTLLYFNEIVTHFVSPRVAKNMMNESNISDR
jgi:hypothetical protein